MDIETREEKNPLVGSEIQIDELQFENSDELKDKNGNLNVTSENLTNIIDNVCRTCLEVAENESSIAITNFQDSDCFAKNMFEACLPQIKISLTEDPLLCGKCFTKLTDFYNFLNICLDTDQKLSNYCAANNISEPLKPHELLLISREKKECFKVKVESNEVPNDISLNDTDLAPEDFLNEPEEVIDNDEIKVETEVKDEVTKKRPKRLKRNSKRRGAKVKTAEVTKEEDKTLFSKDMTESLVKCEFCEKNFASKWALDRHLPTHKSTRTFQCETCEMNFKYKHSYQKHLLSHLNGAPASKPFACKCGKFFDRKAKLKKHQLVHVKKDKPFICDTCGKRFTSQELLGSHILRVHTTEKAFTCEVCGNKYSSKAGLDVHFKSHSETDKPKPEPDLMCDFCGKLFYRKYALEKHRMSHTGDKPHKCEQCGMTFKERYQLTIHMRRHTGERPYDCEVCGFKFASKNRLAVHMRIHTGVRPFSCQLCEMAFTRKDHLNKHVRAIHTLERPFECDICPKTFNRRDYLMKHKKVHLKRGL